MKPFVLNKIFEALAFVDILVLLVLAGVKLNRLLCSQYCFSRSFFLDVLRFPLLNIMALAIPRPPPMPLRVSWTLIPFRFFAIASLLIGATILSGCTRTYVSTGDVGVTSPDGRVRICLTSHGGYGQQYVAKTKKKVDVWIGYGHGTNKVTLLSKAYTVVGSDLTWDVEWRSPEEVYLRLYDFGDGLSRRQNPDAPNDRAKLVFRLNKETGKFIEKR
jgi:hypothetical protein